MEQMSDLRADNLRERSQSVRNEDILDLIQTSMFKEYGCGPMCHVNPLTDRGKRLQLFKILCLTVIPILGVWAFTIYSLSESLEDRADTETAKMSMSVVVMLGRLIHRLQRERDMSVLYLSDLGPGTKTFLLAEYLATDDALQRMPVWPGELRKNPREEFRSKANLMFYIAHHRNSLNPKLVDIYEEIDFYSSITSEFLEWLVEHIKGSGFGLTWKTLVAYQKITRCKVDIGVERAYGAMFYANGNFPRWVDFEFYNYKVHDFKYNYKTAIFYSDIVVPLLMEEVKELKSFGINITVTVNAFRYEIQHHNLNSSYQSEEKAKWFFDNMTEYLDSLLEIQEEIASHISDEVDVTLAQVLTKVVVYAATVVIVISMCPLIMMSSERVSSDIQHYTQALVATTKELNMETQKAETLLYHMVPQSVALRLKSNAAILPEFFKSVTVLCSEIVGFQLLSVECSPLELVKLLNELYTTMDQQISKYDVYRFETNNDRFLVASGLPIRNGKKHVSEIASFAVDTLTMIRTTKFRVQTPIQIRIGINTGGVSAGIIGSVVFRYCIFGDTLKVAAALRADCQSNRIILSETSYKVLARTGNFKMKFRSKISIKDKRSLNTYWLTGFSRGMMLSDSSDISREGDRAVEHQTSSWVEG